MKEVYTVNDVASILGIHPRTVREKIKSGQLRAKNTGGERRPLYRIRKEWVEEFLNKQ